ncbi:MAG: hypothetical protein ABIJ56_15230 [Pseudomonadota bacterium]
MLRKSDIHAAKLLEIIIIALLAIGCSQDICPGLTECDDNCADLDNDPNNCGDCGNECEEGRICFKGVCSTGACIDECPALGAISCADPPRNGLVVCADYYDDDPCLEWGDYAPCNTGETCVDGICQGGCDDACGPEGERRCEGAGFRECGRHDGDTCLGWGEVVPCDEGFTCSSGVCSAECVDECVTGERICDGPGVLICGELDGDPCLEWTPGEECGEGWECKEGACVETQCLDEHDDCVCGENQCCEGHCCPVFFICISWDPQGDWCPNGPGPH